MPCWPRAEGERKNNQKKKKKKKENEIHQNARPNHLSHGRLAPRGASNAWHRPPLTDRGPSAVGSLNV
jgi:hypothetical protein